MACGIRAIRRSGSSMMAASTDAGMAAMFTVGEVLDNRHVDGGYFATCEYCGIQKTVYNVLIRNIGRRTCEYCLDFKRGIVPDGKIGEFSNTRGPCCPEDYAPRTWTTSVPSEKAVIDFIRAMTEGGLPPGYHADVELRRFIAAHKHMWRDPVDSDAEGNVRMFIRYIEEALVSADDPRTKFNTILGYARGMAEVMDDEWKRHPRVPRTNWYKCRICGTKSRTHVCSPECGRRACATRGGRV